MNAAPVVLFCYNRLRHLKRTVRALQKNDGAKDTRLFIYSDGGKNDVSWAQVSKVRQYLRTISGFKNVTIIEQTKNKQLEYNVIQGITEIVNRFGKVIVLEDDILTSRHFLSFMNQALDFYEARNEVMGISAFNFVKFNRIYPQTFAWRYVEGWGWGTWKNRWAKFRYFQTKQEALCLLSEKDRKQLEFNGAFPCLHNLDLSPIPWDICWYISVYLNKGVYITVKQSLTKNIGLASGIHFSKTFLQRILSKNIYATKLSTDLITEFTTNTTPNIEAELEFSKYQLNYNNSTCIHYIWNRFKKVTKKTIRISQTLKALILRRPVSRIFGTERGTPIDRFYIEDFLQKNSNAIHGDVLEIAENTYTLKYGHAPLNSHILYVSSDNSNATLIGNLETGENIPVNSFDCIILTQTLPFIYDVRAVLKHSYLALKPNGTLLLTLPLIAQISRYDMDRWGDYWRFTDLAALRLLQEFFQKDKIVITVYGNYYAASSFLAGMALEDINRKRLFPTDHDYQLILGAIAGK